MQFLMIVCEDPEAEPYRAEDDNIEQWVADVEARGVHVQGDRLRPAAEARTVRVRGGELSVTDGPFAEAGEHIAGYDILECASLEEAVEIASRHPMARFGRIDVRAAWPFEPGDA
ncbi:MULTISPECIES: YciI family protein [Cellulomonas]|uniref:YCII-related protein n=1 Tax=Cellulomonas gilvus (strain ATCC 13127 / NRRL B-14078) TaxID=593907 RepID=F8A0Z7_CELGA|nr:MULTISPECIES: YciI family protein [Cellulomonas]AEI12755.1 YCII-related protein [Cellulomonas gilvus ATCC 13127]MCR6689495.1 YciI family protein [Cellulomonas sp.]